MTTDRKKIAVFGVKTVPYTGGIENVVENTMPYIYEYDIIIYVRKKYYYNEVLKNVRIICLPHLQGKTLEALSHTLYAVYHALFIEKADIFLFHAVVLGLFTPIPKMFRKKVILQTHGLDWKREKWGKISKMFIKLATYMAANVPDATICVGEGDHDYFKKKFGKEFIIVGNGVSIPAFSESNDLWGKMSLFSKRYILFMSRLVPEKGAHLLIKSFTMLIDNNLIDPQIRLVIAGDTNYYDDYYYSLKKHEGEKILFTGFVSGDIKYNLLQNALCFVQPSTIEGMSTGLLEAMRMGIKPVVSDIKENIDVVKSFGYSFKSGSSEDLSKTLILALNNLDNNKLSLMVEYAKNNYSWQNTIDKLEYILRTL